SAELRTIWKLRPLAQLYSAVGPQVTQGPCDGHASRPGFHVRPPSDVSMTSMPGSQSRAGALSCFSHCDGSGRWRKRASTEPPESVNPSKFSIDAPGGTGTRRHVRPPSTVNKPQASSP